MGPWVGVGEEEGPRGESGQETEVPVLQRGQRPGPACPPSPYPLPLPLPVPPARIQRSHQGQWEGNGLQWFSGTGKTVEIKCCVPGITHSRAKGKAIKPGCILRTIRCRLLPSAGVVFLFFFIAVIIPTNIISPLHSSLGCFLWAAVADLPVHGKSGSIIPADLLRVSARTIPFCRSSFEGEINFLQKGVCCKGSLMDELQEFLPEVSREWGGDGMSERSCPGRHRKCT